MPNPSTQHRLIIITTLTISRVHHKLVAEEACHTINRVGGVLKGEDEVCQVVTKEWVVGMAAEDT